MAWPARPGGCETALAMRPRRGARKWEKLTSVRMRASRYLTLEYLPGVHRRRRNILSVCLSPNSIATYLYLYAVGRVSTLACMYVCTSGKASLLFSSLPFPSSSASP